MIELLLLLRKLDFGVSVMQPLDYFGVCALCLTFSKHAARPLRSRVLEWLVTLVLFAASFGFIGALEFVANPSLSVAFAIFFLGVWYFLVPVYMNFYGCYGNCRGISVKSIVAWWTFYTAAFFFVLFFLITSELSYNSSSPVTRSYSYCSLSFRIAVLVYIVARKFGLIK
jgi:hypothetical protein